VPSKYDRADHLSSEILCVIISLAETEPAIQAWRLENDSANPCEIIVQ